MNPRETRIRQRLKDDFQHYAGRCLRIRSKLDAIIPLQLNPAQTHVHRVLERQRRKKGKVRGLIIKGRQQGMSTYTQARFFHRVTHEHGCKAFILTHEDRATANIFAMAELFHRMCPELVKPSTGKANAKEIHFDRLQSGYAVATAKTKHTGRSGTIQLFHGSEVAFWPHAESHAAGVLQCIPDGPGTEIILESTVEGPTGFFQSQWQAATRGETEYEPIFVPWYWQAEYRQPAVGFEATAEETDYAAEHGLDAEQLAWRRAKIVELHGVHHFRHEYPATPAEAFAAEAPGALWTRELLDRNRVDAPPEFVRMAVAVDPSTTSKATSDEAGIIWGGLAHDGHVYVQGDESGRAKPIDWCRRAVRVYRDHKMERLVYESNQGGEMVQNLVHVVDSDVATRGVHASRGKRARAEPVATLYEQGVVHHVGHLPALEDELCTWDASTSAESPNRLDALVWLVSYLKLGTRNVNLELDGSIIV